LDLSVTPPGQVGAFREVLAQKSVRVLVRTALPWAVRIGKEDINAGLDGEAGMVG
jgi:hypothetical protein